MGPCWLCRSKPKDQQRFSVEGFGFLLFVCFFNFGLLSFYSKKAPRDLIRAVTTECLSKNSQKGRLCLVMCFYHPTLFLLPLKITSPGEQGKPVFLPCIVFLWGDEGFTVQYLMREHHNRKWTEGKRTFINCFQA